MKRTILKEVEKPKSKKQRYLCREGRELFTLEARSLNDAIDTAAMWNAVVIKEIKK